MPRSSTPSLPEVFLSSSRDKNRIAALVKSGKIRQLRRGLYTTNLLDPPEQVVKKNLWQIVSLLCPGGLVSHRTALQAGPSPAGTVFVTANSGHVIQLPGFQIRQMKGKGPLESDRPFIGALFISSQARFLLECLSGSPYAGKSPFLPQSAIEEYLDNLLSAGEDAANRIRDLAGKISHDLEMEEACTKLDGILGSLLRTRQAQLHSRAGLARSIGMPVDSDRLDQFQILFQRLCQWPAASRPDGQHAGDPFTNIAFFDAYFSNYIEGTVFEVGEAREIAMEARIPSRRAADGHDILGTFQVVSDVAKMSTKISRISPDAFLELIKDWHQVIMKGRPDKRPGLFKQEANKAGSTTFVLPERVEGTLRLGFEMGRAIPHPFGRAAFLMYLLSEVHPFDDGNGRITRAVVNAELASHGERRIIIPTSFRTEYIDALKLMSREGRPNLIERMMDTAQDFTASVDFSNFEEAEAQLAAWNAFEDGPRAFLRRPAGKLS